MQKSNWGILWVAFIAGVVATFVQFSIPPVLPLIQSTYNVSYTGSASLMSLFALMTLLSAVFGGFIVQRFGVRIIGLLGLGILFGGVVCILFADSFAFILFSRLLQGLGFGLVSVAAPSAIGQFITPKMMSIAMGIWSTWIPLGSFIMFLLAPVIVTSFPIHVYWISILVILFLSLFLYGKFIPGLRIERMLTSKEEVPRLPKEAIKEELKNRHVWTAATAFAGFTFMLFSFNTWISTYLVETSSMSLIDAAIIPSIIAIIMVASNLYAGFLLKKFNHHLILFFLPPLLMALLWPMFLLNSIEWYYINAVILGLVGGFLPTIVFASAPLLATRKETIGIAMSIVIIGENTGILIGPEIFGFVREITGQYIIPFWILLVVGIVTAIATIYLHRSWDKAVKIEQTKTQDNIVM
ncbi:MFS transporter [Bacillus sp. JJ1562]|uniref:MFS transporter n=1 Tax=Bacillus sp. JJ1562 TaxID=3122960 RepID=UPI003001AECC